MFWLNCYMENHDNFSGLSYMKTIRWIVNDARTHIAAPPVCISRECFCNEPRSRTSSTVLLGTVMVLTRLNFASLLLTQFHLPLPCDSQAVVLWAPCILKSQPPQRPQSGKEGNWAQCILWELWLRLRWFPIGLNMQRCFRILPKPLASEGLALLIW